jgi:hypothetical protein
MPEEIDWKHVAHELAISLNAARREFERVTSAANAAKDRIDGFMEALHDDTNRQL